MALKIISYNLNGIRAAIRKGLIDWLKSEDPDVFLVQETKAQPEQIDLAAFEEAGYHPVIHSAGKKGYSGVGVFSKMKPDRHFVGMGIDEYDAEGRVLRVDFGELTILSTYFPSGTSGSIRQDFKMKYLEDFSVYAQDLLQSRPMTVISGDYNICHRPIDIHNPVANKNSSGFLPEERDWFSGFLEKGFVDSFRHCHGDVPNKYSWWTYRQRARSRNLGWRIDYHLVSRDLQHAVRGADIHSDAVHSDHCPVSIQIELN